MLKNLKIRYNAPVVLSFALLSSALFFIDSILFEFWMRRHLLTLLPEASFSDPLSFLRLVSYPLGHSGVEHLMGNLSLLLLIGPIMEEKYGSEQIGKMMLITTILTGIFQLILFPTGLLGASGLVFMFIVLISFADVKEGSIPLSFVLVVLLFIGREVWQSFQSNNISQYAHIMGGILGAFFGFRFGAKGK